MANDDVQPKSSELSQTSPSSSSVNADQPISDSHVIDEIKPPTAPSLFSRAVARVVRGGVGLKNFVYDSGLADSLKLHTPVISVGNLTMGGTGKTPVVNWILDHYRQSNTKVTVVGRNYKARRKGISRVDPGQPRAAYEFGDEPTLTAINHPEVSVYVGPSKYMTALEAERLSKPQVIVVDDGFQHRALHRDLDLVLIDATSTFQDYEIFPKGKSREPWGSLERANWVLLTKTNFVDELKIEEWYRMMPTGARVLELSYRLKSDFMSEAGMRAVGFAGLAKPISFQQSLQNDAMYDVVGFIPFPDHYRYTQADVDFIEKQRLDLGAEVILTTEKDWVKVKDLGVNMDHYRALSLEVHAMGPEGEFHASLDRLLN